MRNQYKQCKNASAYNEWKIIRGLDFNCHSRSEGMFKVTGWHVRSTSDSILAMKCGDFKPLSASYIRPIQ